MVAGVTINGTTKQGYTMTTSDIKTEILQSMAKAFFACAWADQCEESGNAHILSGKDVFDVMPQGIPQEAFHAATTLQFDLERENKTDIVSLYEANKGEDKYNVSPEMWGHIVAMQSMGHGVSLADYGVAWDALTVPYVEFGSHSLSRDYF
jgi:hypothetical protein